MAGPRRFRDLPPPARRYVMALWVLAAVGVTVQVAVAPAAASAWPAAAVFAAAIAIDHFTRTPSRQHSYVLSGPFVLAATFVLPPREAAVAIVLGMLPEKLRSRSAWYTKLFNVLVYLGGATLAGAVFRHLGLGQPLTEPWAIPAGFVAVLTFTFVNHSAVALAVKLSSGLKVQTFITPTAVIANLAIDGAGLPMAALWHVHPALLILGMIPLASGAYALWMPQMEEELRLDAKTGLYNLRFAMDSLHRLMREQRERNAPLAIIMADLDHLRDINNRFGHLIGDRALQTFADTLKRHVPSSGLAARFGGEEFFVILADRTAADAVAVAGTVRLALRAAAIRTGHDDDTVTVTVSLGVAEMWSADRDPSDLVHRADMALYEAKRGGRDRVVEVPSPVVAGSGAVSEGAVVTAATRG